MVLPVGEITYCLYVCDYYNVVKKCLKNTHNIGYIL